MADELKETLQSACCCKDGKIPVAIFRTALLELGFADVHMDSLLGVLAKDDAVDSSQFVNFVTSPSSAEDQLAALMSEVSSLEQQCWAAEDVSSILPLLKEKSQTVKKFRAQGVKPNVGALVFRQIDADRSGSVDKAELMKLLKHLPREKPAPGVEFVPFNKLFGALDTDGDGQITEPEWLENVHKIPGVIAAIEKVLDPDTGLVRTYRSVEEQMAMLLWEVKELELRCWSGEDVDELPEKTRQLEALKLQGIKPSAGLLVFRQIDVDRSGSIDAKELQRMLKALPKKKPAPGVEFVPLEEAFARLDGDGSGSIDEEEWLNNLKKLPGLKMAIDSVVDPESGIMTTYRTLPEQLGKLLADVQDLQFREMGGEEVAEEMAQRREQIAKLRSKGVLPSPGVAVFRQIDHDRSGTLDLKELSAMLQAVPALKPGRGLEPLSIQDMLEHMDLDGDRLIDQDEWLCCLHRLPGLRLALEKVLDPDTGTIQGYRRSRARR